MGAMAPRSGMPPAPPEAKNFWAASAAGKLRETLSLELGSRRSSTPKNPLLPPWPAAAAMAPKVGFRSLRLLLRLDSDSICCCAWCGWWFCEWYRPKEAHLAMGVVAAAAAAAASMAPPEASRLPCLSPNPAEMLPFDQVLSKKSPPPLPGALLGVALLALLVMLLVALAAAAVVAVWGAPFGLPYCAPRCGNGAAGPFPIGIIPLSSAPLLPFLWVSASLSCWRSSRMIRSPGRSLSPLSLSHVTCSSSRGISHILGSREERKSSRADRPMRKPPPRLARRRKEKKRKRRGGR
mmetsp:Transcript_5475/g.13284  ORF Transcript_5475/g.13284 Transcript_5475/m.13284 type:complete len:294 (+) Transcript_5475:1383-2264(+)